MDRTQVAFGTFSLIVGVVSGYFMYTHPEGLNPEWPLAMALIAPAVFVLGGLHLIASGLGKPRLSSATLGAVVLCLWAIVNFAAFFTNRLQCLVTLSFLGAKVVEWHPSELECRNSLRALLAAINVLIVIGVGVSAWHRHRAARKEPGR